MKKKFLLCLMLVIALFTITGCGKKDEDSNSNLELKIGETLSANIFDFTLTNVDFGDYVITTTSSADYFTASDTGQKYFVGTDYKKYPNSIGAADDGKVFVVYEAELKYTGKSDYQNYLENIMNLEYGDGYKFNIGYEYILYNNSWVYIDGEAVNHRTLNFETLDDTVYTIRGYFKVPTEVKTNTDKPLKINVTAFGKPATYIIR